MCLFKYTLRNNLSFNYFQVTAHILHFKMRNIKFQNTNNFKEIYSYKNKLSTECSISCNIFFYSCSLCNYIKVSLKDWGSKFLFRLEAFHYFYISLSEAFLKRRLRIIPVFNCKNCVFNVKIPNIEVGTLCFQKKCNLINFLTLLIWI